MNINIITNCSYFKIKSAELNSNNIARNEWLRVAFCLTTAIKYVLTVKYTGITLNITEKNLGICLTHNCAPNPTKIIIMMSGSADSTRLELCGR